MIPTMQIWQQWRMVESHISPEAYVLPSHLHQAVLDRLNASPQKGVVA
jgi:hypothetical protein